MLDSGPLHIKRLDSELCKQAAFVPAHDTREYVAVIAEDLGTFPVAIVHIEHRGGHVYTSLAWCEPPVTGGRRDRLRVADAVYTLVDLDRHQREVLSDAQ